MQNPEQVLATLRANGRRITVARQAIAKALSNAETPLSAVEIHGILAKWHIVIDQVTVYRELEFLQTEGLVTCVRFQDRSRRYELSSLEHHHHLVCEKCDRVQDIHHDESFERQERAIAKKMKFTILRHSLEFFGLCQSCR